MAVDALRRGAVDFIEKPLRGRAVLDSVRTAIERDAESRRRAAERAAVEARRATLSAREREILDLLIAGEHNKMIARRLGISHKTVEYHRSKAMTKLQAENLVDLMRFAHTP